jgi:ATP-dependent DNA helicase RecG
MSDSPIHSLSDIMHAMYRPLAFAAKNNCAHLNSVKGLNTLIPGLAAQARLLAGTEQIKAELITIANMFADFYHKPVEVQRTTVLNAIKLINNFNILDKKYNVNSTAAIDVSAVDYSLRQLARPVSDLPGVGPKTATALARLKCRTFEDLLYLIPRVYVDRRNCMPVSELEPGDQAVVIGSIHGRPSVRSAGRLRLLEMLINDGSAIIAAKWFRLAPRYAALLLKKYTVGDRVIMTGQIKRFGLRLEIHHPDIELLEAGDDPRSCLTISPLYPLTEALAQKTIQRLVQALIARLPDIMHEYLPQGICSVYNLAGLRDALQHIHSPALDDDPEQLNAGTSAWHRRIVFDEFFMLQLLLALKKQGTALEQGAALCISDHDFKKMLGALPFSLTNAQACAVAEIRADMAAAAPMHRLLQGDVGSGKTVVSLLAACIAIHNGYQAAIMAPTEILAEQHCRSIAALPQGRALRIAMLTGSRSAPERARLLAQIHDGSAQLIIGTHALIQEAVCFQRLGLVVIDEQHKFGVLQRAAFKSKGEQPDILIMTATPIPRTLGLTVYGDLDISVIDELPPGRTPVITTLCNESRRSEVYDLIRRTIAEGNQAFIVYPLVEASEKLDLLDATRMAAHLQQDIFPDMCVGLLHGRMSAAEKEKVMHNFTAGHTNILVATTVVEVGIDVPNAALMIIEHAERLGLSQLHQLRGRVGRGASTSRCVLLAQYSRSEDARKRLAIMEQTNDGFRIAEEDFAIRGPGEFLGTRQSGLPDFRVAHIGRDSRILQQARSAAFKLIAGDPRLERPEHQALRRVLQARWQGRLELAGIG